MKNKQRKSTKRTSSGPSRIRTERLNQIQIYIKTHKYPTATRIGGHLGVAAETIYEDIAYLKDRFHDPIEFDFRENGYYYTGPSVNLPLPQATIEEVEAASLINMLCSMLDHLEYTKPLASLAGKLRKGFAKEAPHVKDWEQVVEFHTSHQPNFESKPFGELFEACLYDEQAIVEYRKPGEKQHKPRLLETHKIVKVGTEWFIFARDAENRKMRTFIPARVKSVKRNGKKFKRDKTFSVTKRLEYSFHILDGDGMYDIVIEFDASVADMIGEKKWRGQQSLKTLPNGNVELHLRLSSLLEVLRWITNWCGKAVPTGPYELETMTFDAACAMMKNFQKRHPAKATDAFMKQADLMAMHLTPEQKRQLIERLSAA